MAVSTIQMNSENDLFLPDGRNLVVLSGAAACLQDILSKTRMRLGEDVYNVNNGVDYLGKVFTPQPDTSAARKSLIDNISAVPDVLSVDQLDVSIANNTFSFEAQVMTIYGLQNLKG